MKYVILPFCIAGLLFQPSAEAGNRVEEGKVESVEVISTAVGRDGRPLLGAAVGVGIGSTIGSGSGRDAAKIAGGVIGAARQAKKSQQQFYGWRYIVKVDGSLQVVDTWCKQPNQRCTGVQTGNDVYIIDRNYVEVK